MVPVGELFEFGSGLSKGAKEFGFGHPFVTFKDVFYHHYLPDTLTELANTSESEISKCSVQRGDVFLTRTSETLDELGMSSVALKDYPRATFNGFTKRLRPKEGSNLHPEYLVYAFRSQTFRASVYSMSTMSTRASLNNEMLSRLTIPVPDWDTQVSIGKSLLDLDRKIELNRRMAATLEEMARALFKSWFVDFDSVRAKAEGRPTGLPPDIDALFPDEFEESEMGLIPMGWRIGSIYEVAEVFYGAPFASKQFNATGEGKPLIRIRDLAGESPSIWTPEVHPKGYMVQPGDIVVGMDGEFRAYLWGGAPAWLNQRVCVFVPKSGYSAAFVRNSIIEPLAEVEAAETATTVIHLGKNDIDRFKVVIPKPEINAAFARLGQECYDQIVARKQQSRTLYTIRDSLLPKLILGQLVGDLKNE